MLKKPLFVLLLVYLVVAAVFFIRNLNHEELVVSGDQELSVSEFDPLQLVKNSNINSQDIFHGSYSIEDGHVWVNKESSITLQPRNEGQGEITITGYMPYTSHLAADPSLKNVTITVFINDSEITTVTFDSDRDFTIKINKSKYEQYLKDNSNVNLKLSTNSSFIPSKTSGSKDERELAYIVNSIKIN